MAEKDITEKLLEDYNDIFSDIVNVLVLDGKDSIKENELVATKVRSQFKAEKGKMHEMERDVAKIWVRENVQIALVGLENQTGPDKYFPLRALAYDGVSYRSQLIERDEAKRKRKKLPNIFPVMTIVLYFGADHWNYPKQLKEVIDIPEALDEYVNDYKINVFEISWLDDETVNKFKSDFGVVARFFVEKRKNPEYVPDDVTVIEHVDAVLKFLSAMTGDRRYEEVEVEGADSMCEVAERLHNQGFKEGVEAGAELFGRLAVILSEAGRTEEIAEALNNKEKREQLYKEFGLK